MYNSSLEIYVITKLLINPVTNFHLQISFLYRFTNVISGTLPFFMVLAWVYSSAMIIKSIVLEKEMRLKEVMKVFTELFSSSASALPLILSQNLLYNPFSLLHVVIYEIQIFPLIYICM